VWAETYAVTAVGAYHRFLKFGVPHNGTYIARLNAVPAAYAPIRIKYDPTPTPR